MKNVNKMEQIQKYALIHKQDNQLFDLLNNFQKEHNLHISTSKLYQLARTLSTELTTMSLKDQLFEIDKNKKTTFVEKINNNEERVLLRENNIERLRKEEERGRIESSGTNEEESIILSGLPETEGQEYGDTVSDALQVTNKITYEKEVLDLLSDDEEIRSNAYKTLKDVGLWSTLSLNFD